MNQQNSLQMLPLDFQMKVGTQGFEETLTGSWAFADQSTPMDQAMAMRANEQPHAQFMQPQMNGYTGIGAPSIATTHSWCSPIATSAYSNFDNHGHGPFSPSVSVQGFWNIQVHQLQNMVTPTIVPQEAMLGGDYVHVDADVDMDTDSYDNADVPLTPSPQDAVFKQDPSPSFVKPEPETSEDESKLKRMIYVSPTGGKTVKKERRSGPAPKKKVKAKSKNHQFVARWADGRREFSLAHIEEDPDTGKLRWADQMPRKKLYCNFPYDDDDENLPRDHAEICGKSFLRPEHRQRHRRTHSPDKDFPCLLCDKRFNRNDNCWAHGFTHVHRPGKKDGRNVKFSLRQVISVITDPKHIEKLLNDWKKEVGSDYVPEDEEDDHEDFQEKVETNGRMDYVFQYDAQEAIRKIRCLSQ